MPSPIRAAPARLPPLPPPAAEQPVRLTASGRLMQWITQVPPAGAANLAASGQAGLPRPVASLRPVDSNRATLRNAIESHLPPVLQQQLGEGREVSGCLRAAINLSCDHVDGWMRRTLANAWRDRAITPAELQDGVQKAEAFAEKLLNEADDHRLRNLIFDEHDRTADADLGQTLG